MLSERDFLIKLAVDKFNTQYRTSLNPADFDIKSITATTGYRLGYEILTVRQDDFFVIHMYLNYSNRTILYQYYLEVNNDELVGVLGDETNVVYGEIDKLYVTAGIYKFQPINFDPTKLDIILTENSMPLIMEDGTPILLEGAVNV